MSVGTSKIKPSVVPSRVADDSQNTTSKAAEPSSLPVTPAPATAAYTNEPRPRAPDAPDPMVGLARVVGRNFGQGFFAELEEPVEIPQADLEAMASNIFADRYFDPAVSLPADHIEQHLHNLRLS